MKILTILGARPQFIKAGPVSREIKSLQKEGQNIHEVIVHTGQHYDNNMSDVFFEELRLPSPDYHLGIGGKSHGAMTGEMIIRLEEVMQHEKPDIVLVYGDTNSTLSGAIAASKLNIPIAHVEAGLRSFNMKMPEEINRILTDRISRWLFCPTDIAVQNLQREGFEHFNCRIFNVGDVMYDAVLFYKKYAKKPKSIDIKKDFILVTVHRAENTDNKTNLINIIDALEEIAKEKPVILPLHPRTKKIIEQLKIKLKYVKVVEPVSYLEMIWLLDNCNLVITDSGGLQKEAYFFKKPCITLREETEWTELVENEFNILAGAEKENILKAYNQCSISNFLLFDSLPLYGNGKASQKILKLLFPEQK